MLKILIGLLAAGLLSPAAFSADNRIEGPVTGYFFDAPSGSVRAIGGTPGAASLSAAVASGFDAVWMAPGGRMSLVLSGGALGLVQYPAGAPSFAALLPGAPRDAMARRGRTGRGVYQVSWSPDGLGAVVYSSASNVLHVVTGLPDNPVLGPAIDLSQTGGAVSGVRLSAQARHAAVIVNHGGVNALYLLPDLGAATLVDLISDAGAVDFSSDGSSLYVVDRAANQLVKIPVEAPRGAQAVVLADSSIMPRAFSGMLTSRDGKLLYATLPGAPSVVAFDTTAWTTAFSTGLEFIPTSLDRLSGSFFVVGSPRDKGSPVWLFDGSQGNVYFVPAGGQSE